MTLLTLGWRALGAVCAFCCLLMLGGCLKTYEYLQTEFAQGEVHPYNRAIINNALRSATVYNEFTTMASFDVLWLSDAVRAAYATAWAAKRGLGKQERDAFLSDELAHAGEMVSFYVLASIADDHYPSLSEPDTAWNLVLVSASGVQVPASLVREVDLAPEYRAFFMPGSLDYRTIYFVQFSIRDLSVRDRKHMSRWFALEFRNVATTVVFTFGSLTSPAEQEAPQTNRVGDFIPHEDYYWF